MTSLRRILVLAGLNEAISIAPADHFIRKFNQWMEPSDRPHVAMTIRSTPDREGQPKLGNPNVTKTDKQRFPGAKDHGIRPPILVKTGAASVRMSAFAYPPEKSRMVDDIIHELTGLANLLGVTLIATVPAHNMSIYMRSGFRRRAEHMIFYPASSMYGERDDAQDEFRDGGAIFLAIALHDATNWPIYAEFDDKGEDINAWVENEHGEAIDIDGVHSDRSEIVTGRGIVQPVSRALVNRYRQSASPEIKWAARLIREDAEHFGLDDF